MEESGLLEIDNPLHKVAIHYVYLPRLKRVLSSFASAWSNHPLRTENNWSPERIWVYGMMDLRNHQVMAVADIAEQEPSFSEVSGCVTPSPCRLKLRRRNLSYVAPHRSWVAPTSL